MEISGIDSVIFDNNVVKYTNEYSIVGQEYFQERVKIWLQTVAVKVLRSTIIGLDLNLPLPEDRYMHICF